MYLSNISIENYKVYGSKEDKKNLEIEFNSTLNLIVGENDEGKSTIVDAIRLVLGTKDNDKLYLTSDDFNVSENGKAKNIRIECKFKGFSEEEAALFLDWISVEKVTDAKLEYTLSVWLEAERKELDYVSSGIMREVICNIKAGNNNIGNQLESDVKELLKSTYLKPLRDAEQELAAKRGSRLSQILSSYPAMRGQDENVEGTIINIIKNANNKIREHEVINECVATLQDEYLDNFLIGNDPIKASIGITEPKLKSILEKLQLLLSDELVYDYNTKHGLGMNNLLFMATELLLLQNSNVYALPLALIEEPEAHLHPQLQMRLIEFLENQATKREDGNIQVIMTSHSPNLASKVKLENLILIKGRDAFPMGSRFTKLDKSDYSFLERFLDSTKANLFFARGVLLVEGDGENLLLPAIASAIGMSLSKYGVSIVNVGSTGLYRYSRVFQREDNRIVDIRVACVTDLDIPPYEASVYLKDGRKTKNDYTEVQLKEEENKKVERSAGGCVKTFVSNYWTLEYDIAYCGFGVLMHKAIQVAKNEKSKNKILTDDEINVIKLSSEQEYNQWKNDGLSDVQIACNIYEPLYKGKASKAIAVQYFIELLNQEEIVKEKRYNEFIDKLPKYLVNAIRYVTSNDKELEEQADDR
ncbi:AAA family ATPase [Clostridium sp. ZBS12]|uniref:ATP-dependent nuclease n=1 Tax=Clostridium sp. ZBS12 TaxID=2949972 RepID=UPI00207AA48D|nr:AAA family ATPase [Clostridium sp. ZBS12]